MGCHLAFSRKIEGTCSRQDGDRGDLPGRRFALFTSPTVTVNERATNLVDRAAPARAGARLGVGRSEPVARAGWGDSRDDFRRREIEGLESLPLGRRMVESDDSARRVQSAQLLER